MANPEMRSEKPSNREVQKALATRLARYKVSDAVVSQIAGRVIKEGLRIGRWDFCPYGICIDYFSDKRVIIDRLFADDRYRVIKLFPYGVPVDDFWHVQAEMELPELADARFGG